MKENVPPPLSLATTQPNVPSRHSSISSQGTPEPATPKSKKKARGKRSDKTINQPKDSIDETIDEIEVVGEGVTKVGDIVAVTRQVVYATDGRTNLNNLAFKQMAVVAPL